MRLNRQRAVPAMALLLWAAAFPTVQQAQDPSQRRGFSIKLEEPVNQSVVLGKTRIVATVKIDEPEMLDRVEFIVGDKVIFVDREAPFECSYDFGEEIRTWIIQAVAHHKEEVTIRDAVVTRKLGFAAVERVNRVILWVSASDKEDNFLTDLQKDQFRLFENDAEQQVLEFYREDRPITMAILVDSSGSMRDKLPEVHAAAASFVKTLRDDDKALIIDFDDKVFLIQDLTSDHEALTEAITSTEAIGGTSIYDALHAAYRKIGQIEGRKVIVLLTDGDDTFSQFSYDRVLEEAKTNATMIFSIALTGQGGVDKSVPRSFADNTGGRFFSVKKADELAGVYERIAEELRAQFYLSYSTTNELWDGRWMKIKVESTAPGVKIRARRGYFAVRGAML